MQRKFTLALLVILFAPTLVGAHGLATSEEFSVGDVLVVMEYDSIGALKAGEVVALNFELIDRNTREDASFDRVFVHVEKKDGSTIFLANLYPLNVSDVLSSRTRFYIPSEGEYEFNLQFFDGEEKIAEHTFLIPVNPAYENTERSYTKYLWLVTLVFGILAGMALRREG